MNLYVFALTRNQQLFQYTWQGAVLVCLLIIFSSVQKRNGRLDIEGRLGKTALWILLGGWAIYCVVGMIALLASFI